MAVTSIQDAKLLIQSSRVLDRTAGLKDLVRILKHNRGKPNLEALGNKAYLALCETLFQCLRDERAAYARVKSKTSRTGALLSLAASALRHVVVSGVRTIKGSTVENIIDVIIEVLPERQGMLLKPLVEDLPKALRALFEYQPHVERLSVGCWDAAVDFCIESLSNFFPDAEPDLPNSWSTTVSSRARTPFESYDVINSGNSPRPTATRSKSINDDYLHATEDFIHCLQWLVKASNAPVMDKADPILSVLLRFLQRRTGRGSVTAAALAAMNSILTRSTLHSLELTRRTVCEVLPLLRTMWTEPILREEILIMLTITDTHIANILTDLDNDSFHINLEAIVEAMYNDYRRRQETTAHQYLEEDYISFCLSGHNESFSPLRTHAFSMKAEHGRYESLWATVSTIARFSSLLDERKRRLLEITSNSTDNHAKRIRVTYLLQEYLRHVLEPRSNAKRAALQVVAFMIQDGPLSEDDLQSALEKLTSCISDQSPYHSAWAMIGLAGAALQTSAPGATLQPHWISAWQSAARAITSVSVTRTACHLMDVILRLNIIPFSSVSEVTQSMLSSIELSGPALLTEASSSLLITIIQQRVQENPAYFNPTAERILSWFFTKWTPSLWSDRTYSSLNAHHCSVRDVLRLVYACLERPYSLLPPSHFLVLGPIAQAKMRLIQHQDVTEYLLLQESSTVDVSVDQSLHKPSSSITDQPPTLLHGKLLDFALAELKKAETQWDCMVKGNGSGISSDMMRVVANSCVAGAALAAINNIDDRRTSSLQSASESLTKAFTNYVTKPQTEQYKVDIVHEICAANLPPVCHVVDGGLSVLHQAGMLTFSRHVSSSLRDRLDIKQSFYAEEDDFMDEEGPNSQLTVATSAAEIDVPRHDSEAAGDIGALRSSCSAYVHLIFSSADESSEEISQLPSAFINYLVSLPESELLQTRQFLRELWQSGIRISTNDCITLLERFQDALIDPLAREYNTSEVANGMLVEVLTGTTTLWTLDSNDRETQDLYENVEALYAYYAREFEKGGVRRSANLQKSIASFLHGVAKYHPNFGRNRKIPSVRTSLFDLLSHGDMIVKYYIAKRLPQMFEDFVLSEHDKILQDIDSSLPGNDDGTEGIAIRLLVLSRLASRWHTLLRQCVYRIFATAGSIQGATLHARRCMLEVSQSRELETPQDLFRLFAPQILFTWLDRGRTIAEVPFLIFDYTTLPHLCRDIEAEAVAQAVMFSRVDQIEFLAGQLNCSTSELLTRNISKATAYTIAWDTCRNFSRSKTESNCATLLKEWIGSDRYYILIRRHFPEIVGHLVQAIDHEERIDKSLGNKPAFNPAAHVLSRINDISHSALDLNIGIEPSFSAFYLPDLLERLCRRSGDDPVSFWTPSTYTLVMRSLLDRIHPALGSLYARTIVRKIRIVVALSGSTAHEGYPLQMTLQSLRPFLIDPQCAEDAVGVMQYLFENGSRYLSKQLSFITGIGLSTLISVRMFLGSSQESTTQQSQHLSTMTTASKFHAWFIGFLNNLSQDMSAVHKPALVKAFKVITTAAAQAHAEGNSNRGSDESRLLLEILDDMKSGRSLLNKTSREVALDLLCQSFKPADSAREDVLGSDDDAAEYASLVWETGRRNKVGTGYKLWTARVLGHAYMARGQMIRSTARTLPLPSYLSSSRDSLGKFSRDVIMKEIIDLFYSDDRNEVSLAEDAIRQVIRRLAKADAQYRGEMERAIPGAIIEALSSGSSEHMANASAMPEIDLEHAVLPLNRKSVRAWTGQLTMALCKVAAEDAVLGSLVKLLEQISGFAEKLLPQILHLVLLEQFDGEQTIRATMSEAFRSWSEGCDDSTAPYVRVFLKTLLYLRSQPCPREVTRTERDRWLEIDFLLAAKAANTCSMYRSALLFAETAASQVIVKTATRRSSVLVDPPKIPTDLQLSIYKNLDEPDSFYGVDRGSNLYSVLDRLEYEGDGTKSLMYRGARLDSQMRRTGTFEAHDTRATIKSLIMMNMNGITHSLIANDSFKETGDEAVENMLRTAQKLSQWEVRAPENNNSEPSMLFRAFQSLHFAKTTMEARAKLEGQLLATVDSCSRGDNSLVLDKSCLRTLGALTEAEEIISAGRSEYLLDVWEHMKSRERWMQAGEFGDVRQIFSCRETLFSVLGSNTALTNSLSAKPSTVRNMEVETLLASSAICRKHGALQESLASVTYLSDLIPDCKAVNLDIEAIAQHEVANVLWEQGETEISIRMRQHLIDHADFDSQNTDLSLPVLLARLGHHLAEARLAKPDTIMEDYLKPAIKELKGQKQGAGPGQVFHEFALFCDKQLQSTEAAEDMDRIKTVMDRKLQEYHDFVKLSKTDKSKGMRETYARSAKRAKTWYELDHTEYERLRKGREQFLRQCLENYLLSLFASDAYNNDALRVFSLWLEYCDLDQANKAVATYLNEVPSGKFALLMNQLSSRLQDDESSTFQQLLIKLVSRICIDHPYHGMHQIFAIQMKVSAMSREDVARSKDESARSRQEAARKVAHHLANDKRSRSYWSSIFQSNEIYHHVAMFKGEKESTQQGRELPLDRYKESKELVSKIPRLNVPPATLQVEVRANMNYTDLPRIQKFKPTMSIANGLSAPKVITAIGTDGRSYKQLFKSGNDDLRQDAIMEQVFDQVSRLLKNHTATRIRNLGIRTYKVLPLSTRSGLMEFVQNTIPLHLWVMPAHERYHPTDYKPDRCRKEIGACQQDSLSTRVKVWQKIADNFRPVMRYFLLERFQDPDEWFARRLAYTRSTAAISILGHVLGLGDRHCHNILLDERSGEIVHIDLGVSFEAGRVLPVPEVVPFRLTRDIVDGMGYTKTEGVFRRSCEFTMDTLREERESIMTLLNVLRYDPLVNWSITPTKAKRMQEAQDTNAAHGSRAGTVAPGGTPAPVPSGQQAGVAEEREAVHDSHKKREQEEQAGEAGRALSVVEKKLSKTLSTKATVNELIQQATDERNLAVLYMGWASYA